MTERVQRDFGAYGFPCAPLDQARLLSLKLEHVDIATFRRRYVDALLLSGDHIIPVPFIFVAADGAAVLHEQHSALHASVREWLVKTVTDWAASKSPDENMVADLFDQDAALQNEIVNELAATERPFIGLSTYAQLFTEAERYATLTPFVFGRSFVDFNPGFGYGARTLTAAASRAAVPTNRLTKLAERVRPRLDDPNTDADVAVWLDAAPENLSQVLDTLRSAIREDGTAIVSVRSEQFVERLQTHGADVVKMSRPGCDGLGALDEWLGVFRSVSKRTYFEVGSVVGDVSSTISVSPRPLNVLFALRPSAQTIFGGDVVQVRETAEALRKRGHRVEISMSPSLDATGFDVVHLTNLTVPSETLPQAQSVTDFAGAVVLMPIFTDHADETAWGMTVTTTLHATSQDVADLEEKLGHIESRTVSMGRREPPPQRCEMVENYTPMQKAIVEIVDFAIANAHSEMNRVYRYLSCRLPYAVAPSCANPRTYGTHARERFVQRFGLRDFVLLAGRYESRKNQLSFFQAARDLDLPLVFIGNNYDPTFGKIVRLHRPARAAYIAHVPEVELAGAFAAARVVAIPSWDEVVSLTSLNAAISEASMVLTRNSYEHEYFMDDAEYCDPGSIRSIADAVKRAWSTHDEREERRALLAERVRREFSWERSAEITEAAYYRVLAFNPRREQRFSGLVRA